MYGIHDKLAIFFTPQKMRMRMNLDHVASGHFVLGETLCNLSLAFLADFTLSDSTAFIRFITEFTCLPSYRHSSFTLWAYLCWRNTYCQWPIMELARTVKEHQKFVSELCIYRQKQNNAHGKHKSVTRQSSQRTSTITCTDAPRVWHFSAFHC